MADFLITDFGAVADGATNNAAAMNDAITAAHKAGGGRVVVPPAAEAYVTGTVHLLGGVELHLANGSELKAAAEPEAYHQLRLAGEYGGNTGAFIIYAEDADHIAITGQGIIDGNHDAFLDGWWVDDGPYIRAPKEFRARGIGLFGCTNLRLRDFTIRNVAQWTIHLTGCEDGVIDGLTIRNGLDVPNCDGIDPDHCRRIRISNCDIQAGDDCIVIKTTREYQDYGPSEDITVTNCTCVSTSAALKIGTESASDIRRITFSNCIVRDSHRGFAIQLRDSGTVEDITVTGCQIYTRAFHKKWWGNAEAIALTSVARHDDGEPGLIKNVTIADCRFRGENGIVLHGEAEQPLQNITLSNIDGELVKTSKWTSSYLDLRPRHSQEHGGLEDRAMPPLWAHQVRGLTLDGVRVAVPEGGLWTAAAELTEVTPAADSL